MTSEPSQRLLRWSSRSPSDKLKLLNIKETTKETTWCLAAAHALVQLDDGTVAGDPMERATVDALEWKISKGKHSQLIIV